MSLIMSFETYEGIVMTADRMSTISVQNEKLHTTESFTKTINAHKLFLTKDCYGLSYCGDSSCRNELLEAFLSNKICKYDFRNFTPEKIGRKILNSLKQWNNSCNVILLLCGYFKGESFAIEINTEKNETYTYPNSSKCKVIRYGDTQIADALLDKGKFYYGYGTYRLQDGIDLLKMTTYTTAKYQYFQENLQTVSKECDILVLFPNKKHIWLSKQTLHI